jgi:uncharacterized protein
MNAMPGAASQMLLAYDFALGPVDEIAIVGDPSGEETQRVLRFFRSGFRPHQVVALKSGVENQAEVEALLPLLHGKTALGPVTTYVCRDFACQQPLIGAAAVEEAHAVSRPS